MVRGLITAIALSVATVSGGLMLGGCSSNSSNEPRSLTGDDNMKSGRQVPVDSKGRARPDLERTSG